MDASGWCGARRRWWGAISDVENENEGGAGVSSRPIKLELSIIENRTVFLVRKVFSKSA